MATALISVPELTPAHQTRRIFHSEQIGPEEIVVRYIDELDGYTGIVFRVNEPLGSPKSVRTTRAYSTFDEALAAARELSDS